MESPIVAVKENKLLKGAFAVAGIMVTLVIYGILQEKIMRVPYGQNNEFFKYSLFLVFCNRLTTSAVSAASLVASRKALDPVAPVYKYCLVSVTNILTTTCQYEALKYVSFPVQTLAKCAKMIPVMVWGTLIMQKRYKGLDYTWAVLVTIGCSIFILYPGQLIGAVDFINRHHNCFYDIALLSTVATASQFFISYTIRTFGALTFATIMTTRQLISILLSCLWFHHPLSPLQWVGAVIVFGSLYARSFMRTNTPKPSPQSDKQDKELVPLKGNP